MSLRFDCAETRRLGLEGHVCELQLTTSEFAEGLVRRPLPRARARTEGAGSERGGTPNQRLKK